MNNFPKNFIFGVSDSDLQTIGERESIKFENSQPSMWKFFAKKSKSVYKNDTPEKGINRYSLWKKDVELLKKLDIDAYRTSVSMSRLLNKDLSINKNAFTWYRNLFKEISKEKIKIFVTLYHWEMPQWLQDKGGWENKDTIKIFSYFSRQVGELLGEYIDTYLILNEPKHIAFFGYKDGIHAPGVTNLTAALQVGHNLLLAQAFAYKELASLKIKNISTALDLSPVYPIDNSESNILASKIANDFSWKWFLDPMYKGKYPELVLERYDKFMPKFSPVEMKEIKIGNKLSSIGINYYRGSFVKYDVRDSLNYKKIIPKKGKTNSLGWKIFDGSSLPEGLFDISKMVYDEYSEYGLKNIYITENGTAIKIYAEDIVKTINDKERINFHYEQLKQVFKAIKHKIPIKGYFIWTLIDNYEWDNGYRPEASFGLVYVNRTNMERIPKKSYFWYKDIKKMEINV